VIAPLFMMAALQVIEYQEISPLGDVARSELSSTVTVSGPCESGCPSGNMSIGAGEIVGRRIDGSLLVLTARHVVENARALTIFVRNGATPGVGFASFAESVPGRRARVVAYAANVDLALVSFKPVRGDEYAFAPLADREIDQVSMPGDVVGDPNGALWTVSRYSFLTADATTFDVLCSTCGPGDSGGGVFDPSGKLLGIVVQQAVDDRSFDPTEQFKAVGLPELRLFLDRTGSNPAAAETPVDTDVWKRFDATRKHVGDGPSR
jgi:S1-C subfamily serine protease